MNFRGTVRATYLGIWEKRHKNEKSQNQDRYIYIYTYTLLLYYKSNKLNNTFKWLVINIFKNTSSHKGSRCRSM